MILNLNRVIYRVFWEEAIKKEVAGHVETGTFTMVDKTDRRKSSRGQFIFSCKTDENGDVASSKPF